MARSAIVAGAEDRLRKKGFGRELDEIKYKGDFLKNILRLALDKGVIGKAIWMAADEIRDRANKAAHSEALPDDRGCMKAFDMTRGILQHLFE
jgi:hypothetical protein